MSGHICLNKYCCSFQPEGTSPVTLGLPHINYSILLMHQHLIIIYYQQFLLSCQDNTVFISVVNIFSTCTCNKF